MATSITGKDDALVATSWVKWERGLFAAAFMAWAGVVWHASDQVGLIAKDTEHVVKMHTRQEEAFEEHENEPYHSEAGTLIRLQRQEMAQTQEVLSEMRKELHAVSDKLDAMTLRIRLLSPQFNSLHQSGPRQFEGNGDSP